MYLRKTTIDDAKMILDWRNDEITRKNSFSKNVISMDEHVKWLTRKLADNSCMMFILVDSDEPVGSIRVDIQKKTGEVSYMIAPSKRGMGYGTAILGLLEEKTAGLTTLLGLVREDNKASGICFEKNGYDSFMGEKMVCYVKNLK